MAVAYALPGMPIGFTTKAGSDIAVGRVVSQSKEMEAKNQELEKACSWKPKDGVFANISHEFRTTPEYHHISASAH
jgi:hypothetical protein